MTLVWFPIPHIRLVAFLAVTLKNYKAFFGFINWNINGFNIQSRIKLSQSFSDFACSFIADFLSDDIPFVSDTEDDYTTFAVYHTAKSLHTTIQLTRSFFEFYIYTFMVRCKSLYMFQIYIHTQ